MHCLDCAAWLHRNHVLLNCHASSNKKTVAAKSHRVQRRPRDAPLLRVQRLPTAAGRHCRNATAKPTKPKCLADPCSINKHVVRVCVSMCSMVIWIYSLLLHEHSKGKASSHLFLLNSLQLPVQTIYPCSLLVHTDPTYSMLCIASIYKPQAPTACSSAGPCHGSVFCPVHRSRHGH